VNTRLTTAQRFVLADSNSSDVSDVEHPPDLHPARPFARREPLTPSQVAERYHQRRHDAGSWRERARRAASSLAAPLWPDYAFDPDDLADIARRAVIAGNLRRSPTPQERRRGIFERVLSELDERRPGAVIQDPRWFITRCGGAEFAFTVVYAAVNEYVALCGSNLAMSAADSGSYYADVWDFVLEGENYNSGASPFEPVEVTRAGEFTFLGAGERKMWSFAANTWMVDYARGFVPHMAIHGSTENATVALNMSAVRDTMLGVAKMALREHAKRLTGTYSQR
jgi:C-8 sterol isomerase